MFFLFLLPLGRGSNFPDTDVVISVTGKEGTTVSGPGEGDASRVLGVGSTSTELGVVVLVEFSNDVLGDEIPDLNSLLGGSDEPVSVGREGKSMDDISSIERVEMFAFVEVPEHGSSVLSSGSTERTVRGDSDSVDVISVSGEVGAELAVGQVPDLDLLVPASRDDQGVLCVGGETNAAHPFGVTLILDGVLALTESIPKADGLVARTRNNLSVVSREGNAENILGVTNESLGGGSRVKVPQAKSMIPRSREGELAIRGDNNILNKVRVSVEGTTGNTVLTLFSGEIPDNDALVSRGREDHVRALRGSGDGSDPSTVTLKDASKLKDIRRHC